MPRVLRALVFIVAGSLLVTAVAGRFRFAEILGWAVFFASLYWSSLRDGQRTGCRR
jgi:hypothetical protein